MTRNQRIRWIVTATACLIWIAPLPATAQTPRTTSTRGLQSTSHSSATSQKLPTSQQLPAPRDVALHEGGRLMGQVVNSQGKAAPGQIVLVMQGQREVARAACQVDGTFKVKGLRGGVYQVVAGDQNRICRCWAANTAPPIANERILLVTDSVVTRGQQPIKKLVDPLLLGVIVVGAVAIPIAVTNSKNDRPSGS